MSFCSRSSAVAGVPTGAMTPHQFVASAPGNPASANVGTSGSAARRFLPPTPSARSLPLRTWGMFCTALPMFICTWPPIVSVSAGPPPLYCTITMSMPACRRKSSVARCWKLPGPAEPAFSWPGFAFASAINSWTEFAASAFGTTSKLGPVPIAATGTNHCSDSSGIQLSAMLTGQPTETSSSV